MDVTLTATLRPEVVRKTLASFCARLLGNDPTHRLIVNIDPVGAPNTPPDAVSRVCAEFFGDRLVIRQPQSPSFPGALRWCWEQVESQYFLNLEDDWELLADLELGDMLLAMDKHPWLATLRLPKGETTATETRQSASGREPRYLWNGWYWECPRGRTGRNSYYGSPSLIRRAWATGVTPLLNTKASPEKQIKRLRHKREPAVWCWEYGVYSRHNTPLIIRDLGTEWRRAHGIAKNSYKNFTRWADAQS